MGGWYQLPELELLSEAAKAAVHSALGDLVEIGVYHGLSAGALARQRQERTLYLIDDLSLFGADTSAWPHGTGIEWICARSSDVAVPDEICFLHHDADHTFAVVHADLERFGPHIPVGGMIALHDFDSGYPGVIEAWNQFSQKGDFKYWGASHSLQVFERIRR